MVHGIDSEKAKRPKRGEGARRLKKKRSEGTKERNREKKKFRVGERAGEFFVFLGGRFLLV